MECHEVKVTTVTKKVATLKTEACAGAQTSVLLIINMMNDCGGSVKQPCGGNKASQRTRR